MAERQPTTWWLSWCWGDRDRVDLPSFLIGLLPVVVVGFVCAVAFRRRHARRGTSPLIVNPSTLAVGPGTADQDARSVRPAAPTKPSTTV